MRPILVFAVLVAVIALSSRDEPSAHVTVVSPFTYHRDIAPILERRCGACHADGGVAPQTFGTYQDARAQAVALRHSIMRGTMPPWSGRSGMVGLNEQSSLTTRELDMLMTWSAGGTPEGKPVERVMVASPAVTPPDAVIAMPEPYVFSGGQPEADHAIDLPSALLQGKWIRAVAVVPGQSAVVRRAEVSIQSKTGEQVIGLWLPGEAAEGAAGNAAFRMPPDGRLRLRIHYQHPRPSQSTDVIDQSSVAVYFSKTPASPITTHAISAEPLVVPREMRAVGFRIVDGPDGAAITVDVTSPRRPRSTLLRFTHRPQWHRRYVFVAPVPLQPGTIVDVRVSNSAQFSSTPIKSVLEIIE